jgi:hypothetical protein
VSWAIKAIIRKEVDACADAASRLAARHAPADALARWMQGLVDLVATKRGLGAALHSGNPAYQSLPEYVLGRAACELRRAQVRAYIEELLSDVLEVRIHHVVSSIA